MKPNKFMFDSFEEYAEIMDIKKTSTNWEAFKMIWVMARSPAFGVQKEEENENETK